MKKVTILIIIISIFFINNLILAQDDRYSTSYLLEKNLEQQDLIYIDYEKYQDVQVQNNYLSYLPYFRINNEGEGNINLGGNLNDLFNQFIRREDIKNLSWINDSLEINNERSKQMEVFFHLFNRSIYNFRKEQIYGNFLQEVGYEYNKLINNKDISEKEKVDLKADIARIEYVFSQQLSSSRSLIDYLNEVLGVQVKEEINLMEYPIDLDKGSATIDELSSLLDLEMYKYNNRIKAIENQLKNNTRSKRPQLNLDYSYNFKDGFDETEHSLMLRIGGDFSLTGYDRFNYSADMTSNYDDDDDDDDRRYNETGTEYDYKGDLILFPFPAYRNERNTGKNIQREIEILKGRRDIHHQQQKSDLIERVNKINHFYISYNIEKIREVKYRDRDFDDSIERLEFLLDKLNYKLELEDYKFNFSYLYGFARAENEEAEFLLNLLGE